MNQLHVQVSAGSPYRWIEVFAAGDDINGNTKAASVLIPIRAGSYYQVLGTGAAGANTKFPYESMKVRFLPVDFE